MSSSSPIRARAAGARLPKDRADLSEVPLDPNGGGGGNSSGSSDDDHSHSRPESPSSLSADSSGNASGSFVSPMAAAHDASEQGKAAMLGHSNSSSSSSFGGSAGPPRKDQGLSRLCDGPLL